MNDKGKKRGIILLGVLAVLIVILSLLFTAGEKRSGVTVASASRELALMLDSTQKINSVSESCFPETDRANWYVPYMDYLYERGLLNRSLTPADRKTAAGELTMASFKQMADGLGMWQNRDVFKGKKVTEKLWTEFIVDVMNRFGGGNVLTETFSVYGTAADLDGVMAWHVVTDRGEYTFGGFSMDVFLDRRVEALVRDREIIRVNAVISDEVCYENMLVTDVSGENISVFFSGFCRDFLLPGKVELYPEQIVDLQLKKGSVNTVRRKRDTVDGRILAVDETGAELEGYGYIAFSPSCRVYQTYGNISEKSPSDIVIGYDIYEVIAAEGKICAVLIRQSPDAKTIRVLLTAENGAVKCHPEVSVTSRSDFTVKTGNAEFTFGPEEKAVIGTEGVLRKERGNTEEDGTKTTWMCGVEDGQRVVIESKCGELTVLSLSRSFGNPVYPGKLEVLYEDGGFYLINETLIEDYLCRVVPAEMPADYASEALKAQAVCARGFAVNQLSSSRYRKIGAHVDDTVNFQVYNYVETSDSTDQAVRDTYGEVLTLNKDLVTTYYFSTSCGYTSDVSLWGEDPAKSPYLISKRMSGLEPAEDVRDEETFRRFIMNTGLNDYECACGWYRWNVEVSLKELTVIVNTKLAGLSDLLKTRVQTRQRDGSFTEGASEVGMVEKMEVTERGAGGIAAAVEITGSENTVRLLLQSAIREVIGSADYVYHRIDGSTLSGRSALASAYFYPEPVYENGELTGYILYGGGSGHGVGMSQNCANALARAGADAGAMLKFFYPGTEIIRLYQ